MPKVISRGINIGDEEYNKDENQLFTYHCICGALALISGSPRPPPFHWILVGAFGESSDYLLVVFVCFADVAIRELPVRKVDNARLLETAGHHVRFHVVDGEVFYLRRFVVHCGPRISFSFLLFFLSFSHG